MKIPDSVKNSLPQFVEPAGPEFRTLNWEYSLFASGIVPYSNDSRRLSEQYVASKYRMKHSQIYRKLAKHKKTIYNETQGLCTICKNHFSEKELEIDHIRALVNGGDILEKTNLQLLCVSCHKQKTQSDLSQKSSNRKNNKKRPTHNPWL